MKINRDTFAQELEMVRAGLSAREFVEQSSCFVFDKGEVITFNDEVSCRKKVTCEGRFTLQGAIRAAPLIQILEKIRDEELSVSVNENGEAEFKGRSKTFAVLRDQDIQMPHTRVDEPKKWKPLSPDFSQAIQLVRQCVSSDQSHFKLTLLHLHPDYAEACDNLQLLRCRLKTPIKLPVLVRGSSLEHLVTLGMKDICLTRSWIHFRNEDGLVYSCRRYEEDYPDLTRMTQVEGHEIKLPKSVAEASERAAVFAANSVNTGIPLIRVSLTREVVRIKGEGLVGWYREVKKLKPLYKGPPIDFMISPDLLKRIVQEYQVAIVEDGKISRLKATGQTGGMDWQYITVLADPSAIQEEPEKKTRKKKRAE